MSIQKFIGIALILLGCVLQTAHSILPVITFSIPDSIPFAGQTISLERNDMREKYDKEQIIIAYTHSNTILQIKRANNYFPIIEPILKRNGIPDDMKYIAVIESNLDPRAISGVKAAGIWQFMPKTGQEFGLEVNEEVDERYHIEKATEAACKYFNQAYIKYKNWITVAASYNAGMGRVSEEQTSQKTENAFDMLLPIETSRYIYRLIAIKQFMENPKAFGYSFQREHFYPKIKTLEIEINNSVSNWTDWANNYGISYSQLKDSNIWLRDSKLTNTSKKTYKVQLPEKADLQFNSSNIIIHNPKWIEI